MLFVGDPVDWLLPMPLTLVCACLVFFAWRRFWPAARRSRRVVSGLVGSWLVLTSIPAIGNLWMKALEGELQSIEQQLQAVGQVDAILVPSSGAPPRTGGRAVLGVAGYERLFAAIEVWRRTGGELILMGGLAPDPEQSLAAGMRDLAIALGVPPGQIHIVADSGTTQQDLQGAVRILAQRFPADGGGVSLQARIVVVTSALHMTRTQATARQLGISPMAVRCEYRQISHPSWRAWLPNNGAAWLFRSVLHETVGLLVYRLRGWAE